MAGTKKAKKKKSAPRPKAKPEIIIFINRRKRALQRLRVAPSLWWQEQLRTKRIKRFPPHADHATMRACVSPDRSHKTCGRISPVTYGVEIIRPSPLPGVELVGFVCECCVQGKILENRQRLERLEVTGAAETENLLSTGQPALSDRGDRGESANLIRRREVIRKLHTLGFTDREIAVGSRVIEGHSYRRIAELTGVRKTRVGVVFSSFRARCGRLGIKLDDLRQKKQAAPVIIITDPGNLDRMAAPPT
jgi:hypothetical protein